MRASDTTFQAAHLRSSRALSRAMESGRAPATLNTACKFGVNCYRRDCFYRHPPGRTVRVPECRYGARCCMTGCSFAHPAPRDPLGSPQDPYACPSVRTTPAAIFCPPAAPVTPARSREEPELTGIVSADDAVFARIRAAEAAGQVIDVADDDVPPPKRVKTEVGLSVSPTTVVSPNPNDPHGDRNDSSLVESAAAGDLDKVVEIVEGTAPDSAERAVLVNKARPWDETGVECGYPRMWWWFGDTALIAAARHGHADVVRFLLAEGLADPTLESKLEDRSYSFPAQTARQACESSRAMRKIPMPMDCAEFGQVKQFKDFDESCDLLDAALAYWEKNRHAGASYDDEPCVKSRSIGNRPTDVGHLRGSIANVCRSSRRPSVTWRKCMICAQNDSRIGCPWSACKSCCKAGAWCSFHQTKKNGSRKPPINLKKKRKR